MILLRLVRFVFDLLLFPLRVFRRARAVPAGAFVRLAIDGKVADVVPKPRFWEIRRQHVTSIAAVGELVDEVIADARVAGIVVEMKQLDCGMAAATSLRAQLARAKGAGKQVFVHLPMGGGTKEVYVASAGKILVGPATQLAPLGFVSTSRYLRRALDRAGVEPDVIACGEYKAAGENLMRDTMSDGQREQLERILETFHDALVGAIAEGRGIERARAAALVDGAPYFGKAAIEAGLADDVAHDDEVPARLGIAGTKMLVDAGAYLAMKKTPLVRPVFGARRPLVAVISVHGPIAHAGGNFGSFATDERVTRMVRLARKNRRVKGVILHVDSPGGSALASDRMHHEIAQLARDKPVVACMANVAASGGYYVAAPAHRIVCEPTTITGSIGVVAARLSVEPLLARLGITTEAVRRGARAGLLSNALPLSEDERAALTREIEATYGAFVGVVAAGRKMAPERVEELARGRVWVGKDALASGLVDALGGFDVAMEEVRRLLPAKVRDRVERHVMRLPRQHVPLLDPPSGARPAAGDVGGEAGRRAVSALLGAFLPEGERTLVELAAAGERVLALFTGALG
jgi:protease-4